MKTRKSPDLEPKRHIPMWPSTYTLSDLEQTANLSLGFLNCKMSEQLTRHCKAATCVCLVPQSCLTLHFPRDCSPPGSSVHGIFHPMDTGQLKWVAIFSSRGIFPTQGLNPHLLCLLLCRRILYPLNHRGSLQKSNYTPIRRRQWHPTPVLLPGKSHGWRSLVGCSPRVSKSRTRLTSLSLFTFTHWRRKWQPTPVFLPGESQGRGSLVGCRLWGRTESDTTEAT